MKKGYLSLFLILVFVLLLTSGTAFAQEQEEGKYKIGFQASFPSYGLSGIMRVNEKVSVQGVAAPFGDVTTFAVRGLYRFREEPGWNAYGYGSFGMYNYTAGTIDESKTGFGAGVGIEYDWQMRFGEDAPPLTSNLEIGIGSVNFDYYDYSTFSFGVGTHYKF